jgi:peptidoglycan/xylan/chitin deacetylase (PgdA/CDA1 family)
LKLLEEYQVKVTFFFIGTNIMTFWNQNPESAQSLLEGMLKSGHRIGYHSMAHETGWRRHLQNWMPDQIVDDINLFMTLMSMVLGKPFSTELGRLPGGMGRVFRHVRMGFQQAGLKAHVHWVIQDPTWGPSTPLHEVRQLARRLVKERQRTVILLHEYQGLTRQLDAFLNTIEKEMRKEMERNSGQES